LEQISDLPHGCAHAAQYLGANPEAIHRFISSWDDRSLSGGWLLHQLEELWQERLENAVAVQEVILMASPTPRASLAEHDSHF
jgi:hypothetical protein